MQTYIYIYITLHAYTMLMLSVYIQAAADLLKLIATNSDWACFNTQSWLKPLRTAVDKVEKHKSSNEFWKEWTVFKSCQCVVFAYMCWVVREGCSVFLMLSVVVHSIAVEHAHRYTDVQYINIHTTRVYVP